MGFSLPKPEILAKPVAPEAAIAFWQARAAMTRAQAKELAQGARWRAFYVTGLAQHDMVETVKDAIAEALKTGETLADFKKRIGPVIEAAGWKGHRVDNIFRTNMQTAYAAGRYTKMQAVKAERPYWQYITVEDRRRRPSHAVLHGMVFPADHEFWDSNMPPNGFGCRCTARTLSERQLKRERLTVETEMPRDRLYTDPVTGMEYHVAMPGADKGFANNPGKDWMAGLDLEKYPDVTPESFEEQRGGVGNRPKPVRSVAELCEGIKDRCGTFATNAGISSVSVSRTTNYLMATNCWGEVFLSTYKFPVRGGFNPAQQLKGAWNKLAVGKPLSWEEEYAMESLWHEITHNRQKPGNVGHYDTPKHRAMEIFTQWTARRTYPQFLESLGGKAAHQADILKNGLGYGRRIKNFDHLLQVLKVDEGTVLEEMLRLMKTVSRADYDSELKELLARLSGKNFMGIAAALEDIDVVDFERALQLAELVD